ncbi:MAG: flagellar basal-body MS-ring/collar protein FliF [Gammaproteobacteria bacterium]|nr:flagellar basal-body MS-ring/collar protein FliF [Gammaproteobacteria bacterium]
MATADNKLVNPFAWMTQSPGMRQLLVLVGLAASISIGVTAAFWMRDPGYTTLFSNISDKESSEVISVLNNAAIPFLLDDRTGAVKVPAGDVHKARLKLAEQGLPKSSGFGLEIMQGGNGFSTSQFMEGARYHHALETELGRTISSLQPVQSARVHLAVPKSSLFIGKKQHASASVLLQLYAGRTLTDSQVAAIVHMVGSSIPDLDPTQVTVVDQTGRLLSSPDDASELGLSARQLDYVRRVEDSYVARIENLLVPMLGAGRVRTTVTAQLDFTQREETQELYDPETIVRSEQVSEDRASGAGLNGGIPGALSNQPPAPVAAAAAAPAARPAQTADAASAAAAVTVAQGPNNESVRRTRNFEMDRTMSHTKQATGSVQRLSVAVLIDEKKVTAEDGTVTSVKATPEELESMTKLVRDAVGFDEARGDSVNVSSMAFYESPPVEAAEEAGLLESPTVQALGKQGLAGALILVIALVLVRPLLRALGGGAPGAGSGGSLAYAGGANPSADPRAPLSYDDKISVARQLADKNPERVAQIVRSWVQSDG